MKLSKHARIRSRQRGFSDLSLDIIRQYGRCERTAGGAVKFYFGEKEYRMAVESLKRTIQAMDKIKGGSIIAKDGNVLTAYK